MARKSRLHVAGDIYHVMVRGNGEQYASTLRRHIGKIDAAERKGEGAILQLRKYISTRTQASPLLKNFYCYKNSPLLHKYLPDVQHIMKEAT